MNSSRKYDEKDLYNLSDHLSEVYGLTPSHMSSCEIELSDDIIPIIKILLDKPSNAVFASFNVGTNATTGAHLFDTIKSYNQDVQLLEPYFYDKDKEYIGEEAQARFEVYLKKFYLEENKTSQNIGMDNTGKDVTYIISDPIYSAYHSKSVLKSKKRRS